VHLFLTGATGSVGLEVLRILRDDAQVTRVTCLVRGSDTLSAADRWHRFIDKHRLTRADESPGPVFDYLEGDLLSPDFAVAPDTLAAIAASVTHILHAAAHIRFDAMYDVAYAINVGGTGRVIEFAQRCPLLRSFGHISTLYVVGTRQGKLPENAAPDGEFNNVYEQTKYEAEQLVQTCGLPVDIYRLALLQGRAEDGYVHHFLESHMLMDAFCRGACRCLPGTQYAQLDMLPTDYTASALVKLLIDHPASGRIWSIAAGDDAPSIENLYEFIQQCMLARGKIPPPQVSYIDQARFQQICECDNPSEHGISPGACAILDIVSGYLLRPKIYTASIIPGLPSPPAPAQWMLPVFDYCLRTGWGRHKVIKAKRGN
jgi:thioester reductase-like protein